MPHLSTSSTDVDIYQIPVDTIDGRQVSLSAYRGKYLLIVNVATYCGFTRQYRALEAMYRRHRDELVVLGFPCNQFRREEPGTNDEIRRFCIDAYDVTFPLFAKIEVNGPGAHPLYRYLKRARPGMFGRQAVFWNFTKFLVGPSGAVLRRFAFFVTPERIERRVFGRRPIAG